MQFNGEARYKGSLDEARVFLTRCSSVHPFIGATPTQTHTLVLHSQSPPGTITAMLASIVVLSLLSVNLALATCYSRGLVSMCARDDKPPDEDLFDSCPGGPGSDKLQRADRCTLVGDIRCDCSIDPRRTSHRPELAHRSTSRAPTPVSGSSSATFSASTSRVPPLLLITVL